MICVAVVELGFDDCSDVVANFGLEELESSSFEGFEPATKGSLFDDDSEVDSDDVEVIRSLFSGGASIILFELKLGLLTLAANSLTWSAADNSWPFLSALEVSWLSADIDTKDEELSAVDLFSWWLLWWLFWHWHPEAVHLA